MPSALQRELILKPKILVIKKRNNKFANPINSRQCTYARCLSNHKEDKKVNNSMELIKLYNSKDSSEHNYELRRNRNISQTVFKKYQNLPQKHNSSISQIMDKFAIIYMNRGRSRIISMNNRPLNREFFINIFPMRNNLLKGWNTNTISPTILKTKSQPKLIHKETLSVPLLRRIGEF